MPDVIELLAATARQTSEAPDLEAISHRATALRRQERVLKGAALLLLGALVVPALRWGGGPHDGLEQIPATRPPTVTASPSPGGPLPVAGSQPGGDSTVPARLAPGSGPSLGAFTAPSKAALPGRFSPSTSPTPKAGYPSAASCEVTSSDLAPGQSRSCQFRATQAGGANVTLDGQRPGLLLDGSQEAIVTVERNGRVLRYDLFSNSGFCVSEVIRPGDLIGVTARQLKTGYVAFTVAAGSRHGC